MPMQNFSKSCDGIKNFFSSGLSIPFIETIFGLKQLRTLGDLYEELFNEILVGHQFLPSTFSCDGCGVFTPRAQIQTQPSPAQFGRPEPMPLSMPALVCPCRPGEANRRR